MRTGLSIAESVINDVTAALRCLLRTIGLMPAIERFNRRPSRRRSESQGAPAVTGKLPGSHRAVTRPATLTYRLNAQPQPFSAVTSPRHGAIQRLDMGAL